MNPNLTQKDVDDALAFMNRMDRDVRETRDMIRTDENLANAIQEYEKVWKVKIKITHESS